MPDPDGYPILFLRNVAQYIEDQQIGTYKAADEGNYTSAERGIYTNGPDLPTITGSDNCIVLSWLEPVADGRANMLWRVQCLSRVKGSRIAASNLAWRLRTAFDHKENVPPGMYMSWSEVFAELAYSTDSSGRCSTSQTLHFRGRRPL